MFETLIVVDGRQHLIGRLASIVAKELLGGQKVVVVRCEELEISGPIWRNHIKMMRRREKKTNTNHERGPFVQRSPSAIFKRMVRGMIPHKTQRGVDAINRLKAFEGIPHPYDLKARKVVPEALRVLRLRPGRKFTNLGVLASGNGWKHAEILKTLEEKRKVKASAYYERKKAQSSLREQARNEADIPADVKATLELYGN